MIIQVGSIWYERNQNPSPDLHVFVTTGRVTYALEWNYRQEAGMSPIAAKTYTTEVICLRAIDFGEADKILHLYSADHGRISAIAKGVKKPRSKMAGACELLSISEVQLAKGKNLHTLCQYQPQATFVGVRSDLLKLAYGLLFAELVNLIGAEMDSHQIYGLLKDALGMMDAVDGEAPEQEVIPLGIEFQIAMLHAAGYHPALNECILTGESLNLSDPGQMYYGFSPELGGITAPDRKRTHQIQTGGLGIHWVNVSTSTLRLLMAPHQGTWTNDQLLKAQKFLQYYFKHLFEKNLHAYDLLFNLLEMTIPSTEPGQSLCSA
jgi:DNA repair protein RecO (recombination protein O)